MDWPTFFYPDPKRGPQRWALFKSPRDRARLDLDSRPWYLRPPSDHACGKAWHSLGTADAVEAERRARSFLDVWSGNTDRHRRAQAELAGPGQQTFGGLAAAWKEAGYADTDERPRSEVAAQRLVSHLSRALPWWQGRDPVRTNRETMKEYARLRRAQAAKRRGTTGDRAIDLELAALSCLCQWAVAIRKLDSNPFADRPRFRRAEDVEHCNEFRPATDEEFHSILRWLWSPEQPADRKVAGAVLAWCALAGQRPGEALQLRVDGIASGDARPPGTRWAVKDGSERISVMRSKGGINPAVRVHPAMDQFLAAWLPFRNAHWRKSPWYFPHPTRPSKAIDQDRINTAVEAATTALRLPERHPHAMRAFYVRVRRADGADDATIAIELGQGSGPGLVVRTYGRADDILGDGAFDWLPEPAVPSWSTLNQGTAGNVIHLKSAA